MKSAATLLSLILLAISNVGAAPTPAARRSTFFLSLPNEAAWQDMAFLAAIPAATYVNGGAPSLIALDAASTLTPEIQDYLRRYRPTGSCQIGGASILPALAGPNSIWLPAKSAEEAALALSAKCWRSSAIAVVCSDDDYTSALVAAPLAARLKAPLLFANAAGLSPLTAKEISRLQVKELIFVGSASGAVESLKTAKAKITFLADAAAVMTWVSKRGLPVTYLAALNPLDRTRFVNKKVSIAGALLAAGRGGFVAPLSYEVSWKLPFQGSAMTGEIPPGLPESADKPKSGRISIGKRDCPFIVTTNTKDKRQRVNIDINGDGSFTGPSESPLATGDTVEFDGKVYAITLGVENGPGKADVRLTWPRAEQLAEDLKGYYNIIGKPPEYLCLIGFPDALPQALINTGGMLEELSSDLLYSNTDEDPFAEIAVARVIAESASSASLYASRVLTYASLLDATWQNNSGQARWENTYGNLFTNVGFNPSFQHDQDDLKWLEPPLNGKKGKRAQSFDQASPLANSAIIAHADHSWWHELGQTYDWNSKVLLAPMIVESGGCATATLDRETDNHSVVARLFAQGAVAFAGNTRLGIAAQELQRMEFWNGVLSGMTIGQAHRKSINSAMVTILDKKEGKAGSYGYQIQIRSQFGDPAFAMRIPSKPRSSPASTRLEGDKITIHAPAQWWPTKMNVPEDWKNWAGKDLYVLRGAGTYARRGWTNEGYDREETFYTAEFNTRKQVVKIEQAESPPKPLGWSGGYHVDENADGSRTYRWSVRLADFDQKTGKIVNAVERLTYHMVYK